MTYTEITDLINSTIRTKIAVNSISPANDADVRQAILDFANGISGGGGGSIPSLQAVITQDSLLTSDNDIMNNNVLSIRLDNNITGNSYVQFQGDAADAGNRGFNARIIDDATSEQASVGANKYGAYMGALGNSGTTSSNIGANAGDVNINALSNGDTSDYTYLIVHPINGVTISRTKPGYSDSSVDRNVITSINGSYADTEGNITVSGGGGSNYTSYVALITQSGTSIPTANVLYNDTGFTISFIRSSSGVYNMISSSNGFTNDKTIAFLGCQENPQSFFGKYYYTDGSAIQLLQANNEGVSIDGITNLAIEIRIYP